MRSETTCRIFRLGWITAHLSIKPDGADILLIIAAGREKPGQNTDAGWLFGNRGRLEYVDDQLGIRS
jgi:hypothetical protein